jgi:hypothetical protein
MNPTTSNTLLDYALNTEPDPLQASPTTGNTVYGSLTFVVSNGGGETVEVTQIQFVLDIGTLAQDLTNDANAVLATANPSSDWSFSMTSSGVFTAVPATGDSVTVTTNGIVFQLFNIPVNQQVGTTTVVVKETASSSGSSPETSEVRSATFDVAKFPYGFYFDNLSPSAPQVQDGSTVTLTWEGSDQATYTMFWDDQSADVTDVRRWTSPPLTHTTSFQLQATAISNGETVNVDQTTTVTVADPEIDATSLQVSGLSTLQGATTVGTSGANADLTVNGGMSVSGAADLASASVSGSLSAPGTVTVGSLGVNAGLNVNGGTTVGELTATGTSNLKALSVTGTVQMLASPQTISPTSTQTAYTVPTDGLLVVYISTAGISSSNKAWGKISVVTELGTFYVLAYNAKMQGGGTNQNGELALPVRKGKSFKIKTYQNNFAAPTKQAWWFPFGAGAAAATSAVRVATPEEAATLPPTGPSLKRCQPFFWRA